MLEISRQLKASNSELALEPELIHAYFLLMVSAP